MWRDISLANRTALLAEIDAYRAQLDRIAAISSASRSICSGRNPVSRDATRLLPILMTIRVACFKSSSRMVRLEAAPLVALHR